MSAKEDAAFKAWSDELAKQVEPEEATAFQTWIETKSAKEAYRGYLREQDYHRKSSTLAEEAAKLEGIKEELEAWYEEEAPKNKELLAERDALKAQLETLGGGNPPPAKDVGVQISAQDLAQIRQQSQKAEVLDKLLPAVLGDMSAVLKDSLVNGFDVDPREVIKLSLQQGIEPWRAYMNLTSAERVTREEKNQEEQRKKWFDEGRRAAMTTNSPDHLQPSGPSVVDYLQSTNRDNSKESTKNSRVEAALREYADSHSS